MGYRRSRQRKDQYTLGDYLWFAVGFLLLILFFTLLNWLGIALTSVLLGLLLCIILGLRYGLPSLQLWMQARAPIQELETPRAGSSRLTPPAQLRAQEHVPNYKGGYQNGPRPKQERMDYEQ